MKCPNPQCNASIGCSCQLRKFPDGTQGCSKCVGKTVSKSSAKKITNKKLMLDNNGSYSTK